MRTGRLLSRVTHGRHVVDISAGLISDRASADAAIKRALIQFGEVPTFEGPGAQGLGPNTTTLATEVAPLAQQNTAEGLSTVARIDKTFKDNVRALRNALGARGLHRSGELGHVLGEEVQRHKVAQYDSRERFSDFILGIERGYATALRQAQLAHAQATGDAYGRASRSGLRSPAHHPRRLRRRRRTLRRRTSSPTP